MINAPGRLMDNGAEVAYKVLIESDMEKARENANELLCLNEQRKALVAEAVEKCERAIYEDSLTGMAPLCIYAADISEGIIGIIAGKMAEKYKIPTFVFTNSTEDPNIYKGSGRTYGGVMLKDLIDSASDLVLRYGGHAGAVGVSIEADKYIDFVVKLNNELGDYTAPDINEVFYDLEISPDQVLQSEKELKKYAPYGEGVPALVFKVKDISLLPRYGTYYTVMGKKSEHIKLFGSDYSIVCFDMADRYDTLGYPRNIDVVGYISENVYQYARNIQIEAIDFTVSDKRKGRHESSLLSALRAIGI